MILLTGATSPVGRALLARLIDSGERVRCLVHDARELGPDRVRVQIALGSIDDHETYRNALRGVRTVIHVASTHRDLPGTTIEQRIVLTTWNLVEAAQRARVERFILLSAVGASRARRARFLRSKALAEEIVTQAKIPSTIVAATHTYAPSTSWIQVMGMLARFPVVPVPGGKSLKFQPIAAQDVAACLAASIGSEFVGERLELAGPETLTSREAAYEVLRAVGSDARVIRVPKALVLRAVRLFAPQGRGGQRITEDEFELLLESLLTERGTADAERLGVSPARLEDALIAGTKS